MKLSNFIKTFFLCAFLMVSLSTSVFATEGGGSSSSNGSEGTMAGVLPPKGLYLINYTTYMHSDRFNDSNGNSAVPDFELKGTATIFRFVYMSDIELLGGHVGGHIILPFVHLELDTPAGSESKTGMGDIQMGLLNAWHFNNLHIALGPDIILPSGSYDKDDIANIGRNYFTFEPVFAVTYLNESGFEVSAKFMYDINTENSDTNYQSGQEFHFDSFVGLHKGPWTVGINGYYYKQVTDDELDGDKYLDGNKGQAMALGPEVKYDYKNMAFHLKYQQEFEVENKAETDRFWFKFMYAF
ncbi:transporter [Geovibrio sp. ADMFC3]